MKLKLSAPAPEQDYRIFLIFMTVVMVGSAIWSLAINPGLRKPLPLIAFTILMAAHISLHWNVNSLVKKPANKHLYIIGQGLLAFVIVHLSQNIGMIFALYMALIGETIGILGPTRWFLLAGVYYLTLSLVNFNITSGGGNPLDWILTTVPVVFFVIMYVLLYTRQTDAREKAQALAAELETANRQLSEYAARVEDLTIIAERQRMARELHDTLSQGLAGLILQLEAADARLSQQHPEKARSIITQAMENARATLTDARQAISNLRENHLEELGDSLRLEISRFESATGIPCRFHADPTPPLPEPVKETVLRTVSEALTNIARHAQASEVSVSITVKPALSGAEPGAVETRTITAIIKDNGLGFDPAKIPSGHYGLLGIRERIRLIGGTFSLDSAPQAGTSLTITLPDSKIS